MPLPPEACVFKPHQVVTEQPGVPRQTDHRPISACRPVGRQRMEVPQQVMDKNSGGNPQWARPLR
eukprot:2799977-Prorocentrum_lima.AAC.1